MAQISPGLARTHFAEISAGSAVPLDLDDLVSMVRLRQHAHCHDHGYVRGPLCTSCNTYQGKSTAHSFLPDKEGSVLRLLGCRGCLEGRTLPVRYHAALARMHLEARERHVIRSRRYRREPWIEDVELDHDAHRFELSCRWRDARWTGTVMVVEAAKLVR
ncbi:endonuclease domain-containing protein [Streptomyces sp. NPDC058682]|uniref:endonuclease domain-containing protein n=1 Tax=Streptomyces sp. NPDC058682 TaxID=3346596 RepID=UPI0036672304